MAQGVSLPLTVVPSRRPRPENALPHNLLIMIMPDHAWPPCLLPAFSALGCELMPDDAAGAVGWLREAMCVASRSCDLGWPSRLRKLLQALAKLPQLGAATINLLGKRSWSEDGGASGAPGDGCAMLCQRAWRQSRAKCALCRGRHRWRHFLGRHSGNHHLRSTCLRPACATQLIGTTEICLLTGQHGQGRTIAYISSRRRRVVVHISAARHHAPSPPVPEAPQNASTHSTISPMALICGHAPRIRINYSL